MKVRVRLISLEAAAAPELADHQAHDLELPEPATVAELLERLGLAPSALGVLVNDAALASALRASTRLASGDQVVLFPVIKGGS